MLDPKDYERMVNIEMMLARISTRIKEAAAERDIFPILFLMNELKLDVNQSKI